MTYDDERTYHESEWAAQRWDWFNEGRIVEPLSFCQFWRTVLVWATIKWVLTPFWWLDRVTSDRTLPTIPMPSIPWRFALLPVKGCWLALCVGVRGFWLLAYPLRQAAKPVGRKTLAGAVGIGERVETFYRGHRDGMDTAATALLILVVATYVIGLAVVLLLVSWLWTLIGIASAVTGGLAIYGFIKSGILGLLWEVAVVVHHGICPPITIVRESITEAPR